MKLLASSLLETLVATVIFLLIFSIAMDALVKINIIRNAEWTSMETEFNRLRESAMPSRDTVLVYSWGTMKWECTGDSLIDGLYLNSVTFTMKNGQVAKYTFLNDN